MIVFGLIDNGVLLACMAAGVGLWPANVAGYRTTPSASEG